MFLFSKVTLYLCSRCRLRRCSWKNPTTIFADSKVYEEDIQVGPNWEIFLEVLDSKAMPIYLFRLRTHQCCFEQNGNKTKIKILNFFISDQNAE